MGDVFAQMGELILPQACAGCRRPGHLLCPACRLGLAAPPQRVFPKTAPHAPVFALGPYADPHRGVILAMKERNHVAVRRHIGAVLNAALSYLEARGDIPCDTVLVPAPTRARSARARGGDPVEQVCRASGRRVAPVLALDPRTADQAGLDAAGRRFNLAGRVRIDGVPVGRIVVVDDVVTTGATLQASTALLISRGADVAACVTLCAA